MNVIGLVYHPLYTEVFKFSCLSFSLCVQNPYNGCARVALTGSFRTLGKTLVISHHYDPCQSFHPCLIDWQLLFFEWGCFGRTHTFKAYLCVKLRNKVYYLICADSFVFLTHLQGPRVCKALGSSPAHKTQVSHLCHKKAYLCATYHGHQPHGHALGKDEGRKYESRCFMEETWVKNTFLPRSRNS